MTACLVCGREMVCGACLGTLRHVHPGPCILDGAEQDGPPLVSHCAACILRPGLSHTHPRRARDRARRAIIDRVRFRFQREPFTPTLRCVRIHNPRRYLCRTWRLTGDVLALCRRGDPFRMHHILEKVQLP